MFLATTALSEFWDKEQELLFLGQWCRLHQRRKEWEGLRGATLASPWEEPGAIDRGAENILALHEGLLDFLVGFLNEEHGVRHTERYWRIVLGPWLLGYTAAIVDHSLHLDRAFATEPGLDTWILDPRDRSTVLDTASFTHAVNTDIFHLQFFSEILESRGHSGRVLRSPASGTPSPGSWRAKAAVRALLARAARAAVGPERIFSDFYATRGQSLALMRTSSFAPFGENVVPPRTTADASRRGRLAEFRGPMPYAAEAAALLPRHLPIIFLEGHVGFRDAVLRRWPRLPRLLLTSVGWYSNESFKLLAAESVESGANLVISQHGGAYGMMDPIFSEQHERRVSDWYFTWGWNDQRYPGAKVVPLPNPKVLFRPLRHRRRTGKWLLICTTNYRYPYSTYFANAPAAHRVVEQLEDRSRFIRNLTDDARAGLHIRLHHADLGWGQRARLSEEFPELHFDEDSRPWTSRADQFDLIAVDHPQTSITECLARDTPSLFFWNPSLWRMRPEANPILDDLRRARILIDSPEEAAGHIPDILADSLSWWMRPEARSARAAFCERYARSSPDWIVHWKKALSEAEVRS